MAPTVSIVLITWDSAPYLPRCAEGIRAQTLAPSEIIVIDNGSVDGSAVLVKELLPAAAVVRNSANTGYCAAANAAIGRSTGEFILLLNPDVFLTPSYLDEVVRALEARGGQFGSATGKLLRGKGDAIEPTSIVDSRGIRFTRSGRHFDIGSGEPDGSSSAEAVEVFGVSGAAALHRRKFLDAVSVAGKPFDEDFFAYREDADLAWRGQLMGWRAIHAPAAMAFHVRQVTPQGRRQLSAAINFHSVKNRFLLRLKNQGAYLAWRDALWTIPRDLVVLAATITIERTSFAAWRWIWKERHRILATRREIQSRRTVSDRKLAGWFRGV